MDRIIQQLTISRNVFIASHENPDGDAIGSLLAMGLALSALGKRTILYNVSQIPAVYRFLPSVATITRTITRADDFDTAIILDCGDLNRIGKEFGQVSLIPLIINIDHHVTNTRFGQLQYIDTKACATAEIIFDLIKKMGLLITKDMATALYTGILTDTGSFRFSNTNRNSFAICEELAGYGVDPYAVAQYVYGTYSLGRIKLLNLALDSIEISKNGRLSIMTLTQAMLTETGTHTEDADGLINYARRIEDVKVAALIHELATDGRPTSLGRKSYHVSLRSDGSVDVAKIAATFGGGGHSSASGFSIESSLRELKAKIMRLADMFPGLCDLN